MSRIIHFLILMLFGCGGGGGSSNSAPTLQGALSVEAKALQTSQIVLTGADAENDSLNLSIENQPDWVSIQSKNNEFTVNLDPDFFDVGEHSLTLVLSDGNIKTNHQLTINVSDDQTKWLDIDVNRDNIFGIWSNGDLSYAFLPNGNGAIIRGNEVNPFIWFINDGDVNLDVYRQGCFKADCDVVEQLLMSVVAKNENKMHVEIESNINTTLVMNIDSKNSLFTSDGYVIIDREDRQLLSTFDTNTETLNISTLIDIIDNAHIVNFNSKLIQTSTGYQLDITSPVQINTTQRFSIINSRGERERIELTLFVEEVQVDFYGNNLGIITTTYSAELKNDSLTEPTSSYIGLDELLTKKTSYQIIQTVNKVEEDPKLTVGSSYQTQGIFLENTVHNVNSAFGFETKFLDNGHIINLISNTEVSVNLKVAGINETHEVNMNWEVRDGSLLIEGLDFPFYEFPDGSLKIAMPRETNNLISDGFNSFYFLMSSFEELPNNNFTIENYLGSYADDSSVSYFSSGASVSDITFNEDNTGNFGLASGDNFAQLWKLLPDGSFSLLNQSDCPAEDDFDNCLEYMAASGSSFSSLNLKLLRIEGNRYTFLSSVSINFNRERGINELQSFQNIRRMIKKP